MSERGQRAYPERLAAAERAQIERRREAAELHSEAGRDPDPNGLPADTVGVALSGGGIRSATFCLGVFRSLARQGLLGRIDLLSTVSGGGYFGSFLGGLFVPRDEAGKPQRATLAQVRDALLELGSKPSDWLRENGRYMSPNGSGDTMLAGAILLRNWVTVLGVVCSLLFTLLAGTAWLAETARLAGMARPGWTPVAWWTAHDALSPFLALPLLLLALTVIPLGWAFWFTQPIGSGAPSARFPPFLFALAPLVALLLPGWRAMPAARLLAFEGLAALVCWGLAVGVQSMRGERESGPRLVRNRLSRWLSVQLWSAVALLLFGLADTAGGVLAVPSHRAAAWKAVSAVGAAAAVAFTWIQKAAPLLGSRKASDRPAATPLLLAGLAAFLVAAALLVTLSAVAHAVPPAYLGTVVIGGVLLTLAVAWTVPFLNLSSHNSLYGARLTRAYLGASNSRRRAGHITITELVPGDQITLEAYDPPGSGGPLHLINVTLNETVSGKSQIEQRDRKGLGMAVGPCGISVGRRHHALWKDGTRGGALEPVAPVDPKEFRIFTAEPGKAPVPEGLDLGGWVSVSGAAFSTGLGTRTSLALSLLLGLANIRLGYWWNCGIDPALRYRQTGEREPLGARLGRWLSGLLPVHAYLLDELLARFHGPARRRWYLSDGGHSENTGAFELIRRRVPFIVVCDAGCDPDYEFEDLGNLARRIRVDFDAELSVFTGEQLTSVLPVELRPCFGTIEDFQPGRPGPRPHALLGAVFYDDPLRLRQPGSVLLILKPGISGDEPPDVVQYQRRHERFPQETTADQFFDEAQWESYRRLGEHIASRVFEDLPGGPWRPLDFRPPPLEGLRWRGASRALAAEPARPARRRPKKVTAKP